MITHPDYISFGGQTARDEYPAAFYEDFLSYVRRRYDGAFWAARPCDVASYYTGALPLESRNTRKKVCMLAYAKYEGDNRMRRYAEALAKRGDRVHVIALGPRERRTIAGVTAYGVQQRGGEERSKWTNAGRLLRFFLRSSVILTRMHRAVRYDLVHVYNFASFLVFAAWYPRLTGAKFILNLPIPGLSAYKFRVKEKHPYVIRLGHFEKCSAACAGHVMVSNHLSYDKLVSRSIPREKLSVYPDDAGLRLLPPGNARDLLSNEILRESPSANGHEYVRRSVGEFRPRDYLALVDSLTVERFD
jgi:hypothetical protein